MLMAQVEQTARPQQSTAPRPKSANDKIVKKILEQPQKAENMGQKMDPEHIREMAAKLQASIDRVSKDPHQVSFHKDDHTDKFVIEIKNADGSVVKQFPPEKVLNLMRKLDDLSGMVIDEMT